jgi:hypothetical protein
MINEMIGKAFVLPDVDVDVFFESYPRLFTGL